jgi:hypothetical protein
VCKTRVSNERFVTLNTQDITKDLEAAEPPKLTTALNTNTEKEGRERE